MARPISINGINEADFAELSMASYGNNGVEGWFKQNVDLPPNAGQHGFSAQVYENQATNQLVIAYRGTDQKVKDWLGPNKEIIQESLGLEGEDPQFVDALAFAERVRQNFPNQEILVTGHSLGGGLAQLVADAYGWGGMSFDAPGMQEITEGGSFSQFQDFFDSTPVTDGFGKVGQKGRFVNRPVADSAVSGVGTSIGEVSELRYPGMSPAEILVSTMVTKGWRGGAAAVLAAGTKLTKDQLERHSTERIFQQLFERNNEPGQLVKEMTVQAVNNGVDGYDNPERGFFGDVGEFFSGLFAGEAKLTHAGAEELIADLEEVKTNHPAFEKASENDLANLEEAQDKLRRAIQTIASVSADTGAWSEKAANGNALNRTVELEKAFDREGQGRGPSAANLSFPRVFPEGATISVAGAQA
ncbi:Mbeg1-like protein [Thiohalorhabdus sp.]|uniref:Mbeg1-like protein n=1 Tax=Thiohalorhabdus sp. TaxID=3094134 RepID=UPI002FC36DA0